MDRVLGYDEWDTYEMSKVCEHVEEWKVQELNLNGMLSSTAANEYPGIITHLGMRLTQLKVIKLNYNCIETIEPLCSVWLKMAR